MATLDLNGTDVTLPLLGFFGSEFYLNGTDNVTNNGSVAATLTEGQDGASASYSGVISDGSAAVAIIQTAGNIEFDGANTYSGGTNLKGGEIALGNDSGLGTGFLVMADGTYLGSAVANLTVGNTILLSGTDFFTTDDSFNNVFTLSGQILGTGRLDIFNVNGAGANVATLTISGANSYSGGTVVEQTGFTLAVGNSAALGTGSLQLEGSADGTKPMTLQAVADVTLNNDISIVGGPVTVDGSRHSLTLSGTISGVAGLVVVGGVTLSHANTYSHGTTVKANGAVAVGDNAALGTGTLTLSGALAAAAPNLTLANNIVFPTGSSPVVFTSRELTLSGTISGSAFLFTVEGGGVLTLPNNNTAFASTDVESTTIAVGSNFSLGGGLVFMDFGAVLKSAAANLVVGNPILLSGPNTVDTNGNAFTLSGDIHGSGDGLDLIDSSGHGTGVLTLTGLNGGYSGRTTLSAGTLELAAGASAGTGTIAFNGPAATLQIDDTTMPTNTIDAFALGDIIDLRGLAFVAGATASYNSATHVLTVTSNSISEMLTLTNPATITFGAPTNDLSGGTQVSLATAADLSITKTDGVTTIAPGTSDTYTITVTNNGPSTVSSVTLSDTIPATLLNPAFAPSVGAYDSATGLWSGLSLASGQSVTMTLFGTIDPNATGLLTNTVTVAAPPGVTDTNLGNNTATDIDTLTPPTADLSVTKTDGLTTIAPGTSDTYTITVTNHGPSTVSSVTLSDTIPAALLNPAFAPSVGAYDSATGLWSGLSLASGQSVTMTLFGTIDPNATGLLTNTVTVAAPPGVTDTNLGNNTATDIDTLTPPTADLSVTKTDGLTTIAPGTSDTYTITVTNHGPSTVSSVTLSDTIPAALLNPAFAPSVGAYDSATGLWSGLSLASGQSVTMTLFGTIDPNATGLLTNTVTVAAPPGVTDTNLGNNTATDIDTLTPPTADLSVTKTDGLTTIAPGTSDTYTITVTNNGPSTVSSVTLSDTIPAALLNPAFAPSVGAYDSATGLWSGLSLASGQSVTMTLFGTIDPDATGLLTNTVTVAAPPGVTDTNLGNNTATDIDTLTPPTADLSVTKTDGLTTIAPGTSDTYTITVTNNGPSTVSSVTLSDTIPAALLNPAFAPSVGAYDSATGLWSGLSLASGQSVTMTLFGTIDPNATGLLTNTVTVAAPPGVTDTNLGNNTATDIDTLTPPTADLSVTKTDGLTTIAPGTSDTYTITVTNNGPSTVSSVTLSDTIPAALLNPAFAPSVGAYDSATGLWSGLSLASGQSVTMTLFGTIDPNATGLLTNTVTVAAPPGVTDTNLGNNTATDIDTLTPPTADLSVTKTDGLTTIAPGTSDTYTITVTNNGPSTVSSVTLSDTIPAALLNPAFAPSVGAYDSATGLWSGLSLASGQSVTMTLFGTIDPNATGLLTNTVTVAAPPGVTDTNLGNNTATDIDTLTPPTADLSVTKTDGLTTIAPGTSDTYTITVTNNGPSTVSSVTLSDTIPAALLNPAFAPSVGAYDSATGLWSGLSLASGQSVTMTLFGTIDPNATGLLTNTVTVAAPPGVTDTNLGNNTATDIDTLTPEVALSISKSDGKTTVVPGTSDTYTITVTNNGPSTVSSLTLTDPIPSAFLNPVFTPSVGTYTSATGLWSGLSLASGQSVSLTLSGTIDPAATGSISNTATVSPPAGVTDTNTDNAATDTDLLTPQADLSITKTDGLTTVAPGTSDTYTITVTNNGPSTVSSVTLTDVPPSALLNPVFGSPSAGSYNSATGLWSGLSLASGQSVSITLSGTIDPNATGSISNTVTVAAPAGVTDTNPGNNSATDTDRVPSLSVVVSGNSAKVGFPVSAIATPDAADAAAIISYQWQSSADNGVTWNPISGATGSSHVVQASDGNKLLRAHASFTVDNQLVTADSIAFNGPVLPDLVVSGISAASSIAAGNTLSFSYNIKNAAPGDDTVSSWAGIFLDNNFATTFNGSTWNLIGAIAAGGSAIASNSISTSGLALGDHTLTVMADYWNDTTHKQDAPNDVAESNETNNATTIHFTVQQAAAPAALPDLVVDSITNPSVVNQGDAFGFSYAIKDIGTGDVHAASWAGIFLDGQATTLFGGTSPSGWNHISAMAAGGSVTASNSFSTAGLLGTHTLTIEADYWNDATGMANNGSNDVAESNEGNNSTTIHFTVNAPVAPALPDLVVDSITQNSASVHQGDNFNFSYVIKDIGAGPVNNASWGGIFLDGQATTLFGGTSTSGWNHIGPMGAGGSVTALNSFSTAGLSLGDHTLTVEADYWNDAANKANSGNNNVTESNETNNTTTIHFTVTAPALPDLVIDSITPSATSVALGQSLNFSYVVKDIGAGGVHSNSWAGIFLDNNFASTYQGNSFNLIGTMDAGGAVTVSNSINTAGLSLGDHILTVKADYWNDATGMPNSGNNDVAESNEANNSTSIHFTVTAAAQQAQIAAANDPVTIGAGETVDINSAFSGSAIFAADTGTLKIDDSASFAGTVAGMSGQDTIDFADIPFAGNTQGDYSGASGKLTVTEGSHSANIALIGNYMASTFVASDDGHGGTSVVDPVTTNPANSPNLTAPHA